MRSSPLRPWGSIGTITHDVQLDRETQSRYCGRPGGCSAIQEEYHMQQARPIGVM